MRIVTISDNPNICSGLAKVHGHVIDALDEQGHEVIPAVWFPYDTKTLAMIRHGAKVPPPKYKDIPLLPMAQNENSPLALMDIVTNHNPDVVLTIGDYWKFHYVHAVKERSNYAFKWAGYFTVEEEEILDKWIPLFRYVDVIAVPSLFGQFSLVSSAGCKNTRLIPYGTDEAFSPCSPGEKARLREARGIGRAKVRFVTVAQNTSRKNLPSIVLTARLLKNMGDDRAQFHIHTNVGAYDPSERYSYDLRQLIKKLDVEDRVTLPSRDVSVFDGAPEEELVEEHRASDVYLCTSLSEGYGLPVVEAMACGLPVLANGSTTLYELLGANYGDVGAAPRGWISEGRVDAFPPAMLCRMTHPPVLAKDIASICDLGIPEGMPEACSKWARARTWKGMGSSLRELLDRVGSDVSLPVEEV